MHAGSSDPSSVQEHMLKLFDNCSALIFGKNNTSVTGMRSSEGESFEFLANVSIDGPVEQWMQQIEKEMRQTLFRKSKEGIFHYAKTSRNKSFFLRSPSKLDNSLLSGGLEIALVWSLSWVVKSGGRLRQRMCSNKCAVEINTP